MPELPEVEIVRQSLNKKIKQKRVEKVLVRNRNLRFKIPLNLQRLLKNQKILKVDRFSKYLIFFLSNGRYLLLHLGMSGTVHIVDRNKKQIFTNTSFYNSPNLPKKHNHVEIIFKGFRVVYNDPRRFGFFQILDNFDQLKKKFARLGPEPFQSKFNTKYIYSFFQEKEKNVKNFLIDQNFVSGIGNIYASEILFLSKINPNRKAKFIGIKDCKNIVFNSKKVLSDAIQKGGSTIRNFKNINGIEGGYQKNFNVYQREGLKCKKLKCSGTVIKKNISNRSTFFCDVCQK